MVLVTPSGFLVLAKTMVNCRSNRSYRAKFGCSPLVCTDLWERLKNKRPRGAQAKHLLWALLFLKTYNTEDNLSELIGTTSKTFRKWTWLMLKAIHKLKNSVVSKIG